MKFELQFGCPFCVSCPREFVPSSVSHLTTWKNVVSSPQYREFVKARKEKEGWHENGVRCRQYMSKWIRWKNNFVSCVSVYICRYCDSVVRMMTRFHLRERFCRSLQTKAFYALFQRFFRNSSFVGRNFDSLHSLKSILRITIFQQVSRLSWIEKGEEIRVSTAISIIPRYKVKRSFQKPFLTPHWIQAIASVDMSNKWDAYAVWKLRRFRTPQNQRRLDAWNTKEGNRSWCCHGLFHILKAGLMNLLSADM